VVDPADSVCFQVPVPNDRQHIAAFLGAVYELAKPYKWANDDAHTAIQVGAVWLAIFEALRRNNCDCPPGGGGDGDDMPRLRQSPTNPCILEQECLPDQWITLFDVSLCLEGNPGQPGPGDQVQAKAKRRIFVCTLTVTVRSYSRSPSNPGGYLSFPV